MSGIDSLLKRRQEHGSVGALDFLIELHNKRSPINLDQNYKVDKNNDISTKYSKVLEFSQKIAEKKSSEEFDFLLEYAVELRKIEMSETYLGLIKYLLVQYDRLNEKNKKNILIHIANAIKLSRDEELISLLLEKHIELLYKLNLSPKAKDMIVGTQLSNLHSYEIDNFKYLHFDLHTEPEIACSLLLKSDYFQKESINPETHFLFCNLYAVSRQAYRTSRYILFMNKYLSTKKLPLIKSIDLESQNVLSSISFNHIDSKKDGPLVSIIMSAYQAQDTIDYAVKSLLEQSYKNIEILICDDSSDDKTLEKLISLAELDARVKVFKSRNNQGTYNIRNDLIKKSIGEYITFQDSDDYALPNRIELQVETLVQNNKKACYSQWLRLAPNGSFVYFHDDKLSRFCAVSSMVRRDVFNFIGPFRQSLVAADTEFYEKAISLFGEDEIIKLDQPLILGLWGDGSLTKIPSLTAENNGYVAPRRRKYSDMAARQRVLGESIISDEKVKEVLSENKIFKIHQGVLQYANGVWK